MLSPRGCTGATITRGPSIMPDQSSDGASSMTSRTSIHSYRLAAGAGLGGEARRALERALVGLDIDH